MIKLPSGISVIIVAKEPYNGHLVRTKKFTQGYSVEKASEHFAGSGREFRIYPIDSKTKYTKVPTELAWKEGMSLEEFEDYLND